LQLMSFPAPVLTPLELSAAIIRNPLVVSSETTVMEAIAQMSGLRSSCETTEAASSQLEPLHRDARSSCVIVLKGSQVAGILTERDVVRLSAQRQPLHQLTVQQVMAPTVMTLHEAAFTNLFSAINLLQQHQIRHLPILNEHDQLVGLVTHETLRHIARPVDLMRLRRVEEVMNRDVVCADPACSMLAIAQIMAEKGVSSVVVIEGRGQEAEGRGQGVEGSGSTSSPAGQGAEGRGQGAEGRGQEVEGRGEGRGQEGDGVDAGRMSIPVGIITERDLVQFQALGLDLEAWSAASMMSTPVFTMPPQESLWTVQQMMAQRLIRRVVITGQQGELIGIVTQSSLLDALNPLEIYRLAEVLESRVERLEAEKVALLESRTLELERQVAARTAALQAKMEREALLMSLADQIRSSLDLQDILNHAVTQVRSLLQCDRVIIYQLYENLQGIVLAEAITAGKSLLHNTLKDSCVSPTWLDPCRQGKMRVIHDIHTEELSPCHRDMLVSLDIRAKLMVPILIQGQVWGLMVASHRDAPYHWQPDELDLLQQLSVHIAIAIQQGTIYAQAKRELEERRRAEDEARRIATERQQALDSLRESKQRYATLAASVPVGIFRTNAEGRCIYVNQRCCEMGGHNPEDALGFSWHQALHPDDRDTVMAEASRAIQEHRPFKMEYRFLHSDGTVRWVLGQTVAEQNAQGEIIGYIGTLTDISDRKQAELALQQSEVQSRAILAAIPDLMIRMGADGVVRGYSTENRDLDIVPNSVNAIGKGSGELLPTPIAERQLHYIQQAIATGELQVYEQQVWVGDRLQEEEVRMIKSGDDEVLLMIRDITERKRAEAALKQSERKNRIIVETMPDLLIHMDRDGRYMRLAGGSEVHVKPLPDQPSPEPDIYRVLPRDLAEQRLHYTRQALETGQLQVYEQLFDMDGDLRYEEVRIAPLHDQEVLIIIRDVTDRNRAEAERLQAVKVRQELKLLEQILDVVLAGYWDWDIVNHQEYLSPGFKRMLGYAEHELANTPESWQHLMFPEDLPMTWERLEHHVQSRGTIPFYNEVRYRHKNGSTVWVICSGQVIEWDADGNPLRMVGCHINITERKHTELERQRLIQELSDFKFALDQSAIVAITNAQGIITYVNDRFCEISGYSQDELLGQTHQQVNSGYHPPSFFKEIWQTIARGNVWYGEICNRTKDGRLYWVESTLVPFLNDQGKPVQYLAIRFDITARKLAEKALQESQQFSRTVIDTVPLPLLWKDRNSVFLGCNRQLADLLGLVSPEDIIGKTDFDLSPIDAEAIAYRLDDQQVMQTAEAKLGIQETITLPDGEQRWIETHKAPLRDWSGEVVGLVGMFQDITERKQAELTLQRTNEELARATRMKDEFLANMSHELRTPLNAILGMTEGLQEGIFGELNQRSLKALETVERSGSHLLELINDILDIAKIESGQMELDCAPIAVAPVCHASLAFIKQQALKKRLRLEVNLPAHLPDLYGDERRIRQVLINLLNNAVKFTPAGGHITLTASYHPTTTQTSSTEGPQFDCLRIAVKDTGIGIAAEYLDTLFQPFVQVDSALNRKYEGTGLGLALVKRIVDLHGGSVEVISELDLGSCFTINLPCAPMLPSVAVPPQSALPAPPFHPGSIPAFPQPSASPLILLAEDNEANIGTLSSYLTAKGYRLTFAKTGQEAIALAQSQRPDVILMDIQMPGMDGLHAIQQIRQDPDLENTPIIALTALAMEGDRDRCLAMGANDYLTKPVKLKQLTSTIQQLLMA